MFRVEVLLLALVVLTSAAVGSLRALTAHGRSVRSRQPLAAWPLRLFTACLFLATGGLVLLFIAQLPWLRSIADNG